MRRSPLIALLSLATACSQAPSAKPTVASLDTGPRRLPTGRMLDPVGTVWPVGSMPLAMTLSPSGREIVVLLNGWREQGVQVVDRASGRIVQTLPQAAAFLGIAFSPDGRTLYVSGGNQDVIYRYAWADGRASLTDSIVIEPKAPGKNGKRYPAGLALSPDGARLYVAENLTDSLAVVDVASAQVVQRFGVQRYPYGVVVDGRGTVYVSSWGGSTVAAFTPTGSGLAPAGRMAGGRHPSAMLLNRDGSRLFVTSGSTDRITVLDPRRRRVITSCVDDAARRARRGLHAKRTRAVRGRPPALRRRSRQQRGRHCGSHGGDSRCAGCHGRRCRDGPRSGGVVSDVGHRARRHDLTASRARVAARDPMSRSDAGQGSGRRGTSTSVSTRWARPPARSSRRSQPAPVPRSWPALSARVARANRWGAARETLRYPPIEHVIYVIKENRTYDQVLGDLPQGDGDTSLLFFPRAVSPNHHALAERFGLFDRFFVNAEVSAGRPQLDMAAYTTDYLQKTVPSNYSGRGRTYDYEGTNRGRVPRDDDDDVSEPANGYLWDLAQRAGHHVPQLRRVRDARRGQS